MNRRPVVLALLVTLLALVGCGGALDRDRTVNVQGDDAEMNAAIEKARETLPNFWEAFEKRDRGVGDFAIKVRITDANGVEHFWANNVERKDGKIFGVINNDPNTVKSVKMGDRIEIPEADISDWLYMRADGKMVGNRTLRPLLKTLSADEAAKLRSILAEP
ncbi:YegJ family protein [Anatilimnocola floriformis]|uniref:YegJ family protein n=1 Tax=Anatilimnocola floriformis TaxID=2948575 RepID=UPI0020C48E1E|nr:DUF2314 domain-containing protein [Anatilimnocola floriformis]